MRKKGAEHATKESELSVLHKFVTLDSILRQHNAVGALKTLVASGCDEAYLLVILDLIRQDWPGLDTSLRKTGLSRKRLKAAIGRFLAVANTIEQINGKSFGLFLFHGSGFDYLRVLPTTLRIYAAMLERPTAALGPVRYPMLNGYKCYLTQHVIERTQDPHDKEMATLIYAALPENKRHEDQKYGGPKTYDAIAQKQWRRDHYHRTADILGQVT